MEPPDVLYERWAKIKLETRQALGHMLHISVFWWHVLFRQQENHSTTAWAVDMGFLDSNVSNDLSLKRLHRIEILELILNTIERFTSDMLITVFLSCPLPVSLYLSLQQEDCLVDAVKWLEEFGPPGFSRKLLDLGPKSTRYHVLQFIFIEYARYVQVVSCSKKKMIRELSVEPEPWSLQKSEEMKNKGNEQFQKKKYDLAVKWYTKAIKYHTNNHLLYGNRALCFLRCEKYLKAVGDGKRAIILKRDWAKGHYRFCDALFFLGDKEKALEANMVAQNFCSADPEGMRDLCQQYSRFMMEPYEVKGKGRARMLGKESSAPAKNEMAHFSQLSSVSQDMFSVKFGTGATRHSALFCCSEMGDRKTKSSSVKQAVRSKHPQVHQVHEKVREQFCAAVLDAYTALADQRCRNAEQAFSLALSILDSSGTKDLGITELDKSLLLFGYATALVEIGQPEELAEAQRQFAKLSSSEDRKFQCLVHFGIGKVFLKENRFPKALEEFSNALLMVQRQITPGKLTWPTTKVTVEETRPEYLKEQLMSFIELCKFAPKPDAVCRHQHCLGHAIEIYFTDPDFKGFIQISCCQSCKVEFHINCWKKLKAASFADKNDKDFLQDLCFTPDCTGRICHIVIFGSTGLIKCKFESSIPKSKTPGRSRVKQKCTSLKKLKSKEDRKLKRKQQRAAASLSKDEMNSVSSEEGKDHTLPKDYTIYGDRVLHQIYESRELFNDEIHNISTMVVKLRPWMELDEANGRESILKNRTAPKVLRELVDLLLERNNRVWARLFIQYLSDCLNIKPKLHDWAQQLDKAGLKAAEKFIDRYGDRLEELDLSSLLTFSPLQDVLIEKFGTVPELFDNTGLTVMDYIKQAPPQEVRLFIWTLEEHRERYPTGFAILDEYFEMDGICLVIKKRENEDHLSVIVLSGMRSGVLRDEEDEDIFSEEDSLMLLDGTDPFSVPDHLRDQVAEFEGQYDGSGRLNNYKRFLDNNPDPTKETLYDYFAQILEEHGPLQPSDPLLVGELENFPVEAQRKIEAAGGLEGFLLESLRFVMTENLMGLMTHAVSLQGSSHLNPTAREFMPQFEHFSLSDNNASCDVAALLANKDGLTSALSEPHNSLPGPCPTLPDPRAFGSEMPHVDYMVLPQDTNVFENLKVQERKDTHESLQKKRQEDVSELEAEVEQIQQIIEITHTEHGLLQQKLEEEIRKDQQEKRDNQETVKALKGEIKELEDLRESYSKQIQEKNVEYQTELNHFLEKSNQSAAEKMSLEDEIKRCKDMCAKATSRSLAAFLLPPSNHQPVPQQFPVRHVVPHAPYGAQQHPVRSQTHPAVNTPLAQPAERATHTPPAPSAPATHTEAPQRPAAPAAPAAQTPRAPTPVQQPHGVFDRIIDRLSSMFPHYNRPVLSKFIQEVRTANAGTLNMLTYEEVINRVAQLILDHQENSRGESTVRSPTPPTDTCRATPTPPPAHVWKTVSSQHRYNSKALNMEDPCIICHEDMAPEDLCVLECRHSFHRECIKSWLKEQSTCPTCREHALLPEDFPMLPGRHRRGHAPATSFS
uniref:RING-type E3 ubiquitin transferase n=1 Tax=Pygocentrus nattereri TaxID=42514 RepID=A0A3B4E5Q3_PYGNA